MTVTDNYYCPGGVCPGGGFTIQTAAHDTTALSSSYTTTDGTTFTGAPGTIPELPWFSFSATFPCLARSRRPAALSYGALASAPLLTPRAVARSRGDIGG